MLSKSGLKDNFFQDYTYPRFLTPDLNRIRKVLANLGNPHLNIPPTIHVAGTNGKGSVVENLRSILTEAGHRCHVYSSPHLVRINERIKIAGTQISDGKFLALKTKVDEAAGDIKLTWFDVLTCIAFLAFAEDAADYTLLETGMGGRFDATNVVTPILSLITSISYDHQKQLGDSLAKITHQKAGIIKQNIPVIVGPNSQEIQDYLKPYCPVFCGRPSDNYIEDNRKLSRKAAEQLGISDATINTGLSKACLPGRFQKIAEHIYIDGAHNEGGALALAQLINNFDHKPTLVIAMTKDKEIDAFLKPFQNKISTLVLCDMKNESYIAVEELKKHAEKMKFTVTIEPLTAHNKPPLKNTSEAILYTGSLLFIGEVLKINKNPLFY